MKYIVKRAAKFEKDLKLAQRQGCDINKLNSIVKLLAEGQSLPPQHRDHPLKGELTGYRECHINADWLLVYKLMNKELVLYLVRLGSHSNVLNR